MVLCLEVCSLKGCPSGRSLCVDGFAISSSCDFCRHADDVSGLTWGGQSYETRDARANGTETMDKSLVSAGVDIKDTEVVLLNFQNVHTKNSNRRCRLTT